MLNVKQLLLKDNVLLVEEYPPQVQATMGTANVIQKTEAQLDQDKARIRFRVGKVIATGAVKEEALTQFSTKGESLVGKDILYTADAVDVIDIPLNDTARLLRPVTISINYVIAIVLPE